MSSNCQFQQNAFSQWVQRKIALMLGGLFLAFIITITSAKTCNAQTYVTSDLGGVPTAGTYVYNGAATPPTYTVSGSGNGMSNPGFEVMQFTSTTAAGNLELRGRIVSQSSANTGAYAGLMMRESNINATSAMATIGVTKSGTISFTYRGLNQDSSVTTTGPTVTLPVYVRLVKSGTTITGYYSQSDPQSFTTLGSGTSAAYMPSLYYAGFCSFSTDNTLNAAVFDYVSYMASLPQPSANLLLWLRGDLGVTGTTTVSQWSDQSGNGRHATQGTAGLKPSLVTGALNSGVLPTLSFNGSQYLSLAADYSGLSNGMSLFVVLKPAGAGTGDPCAFGNASNVDAVFSQTIGTQASLTSYNNTTSSTVTTTTNPLSTSQYKLLEETLVPGATAGTAVGTIYVNGTQIIQSTASMQNPAAVTRSSCFVAAGTGATNIFNGNIAEILLYNNVSASQRATVEAYILSKYGIGAQPTLDAPTFSLNGALVTPGQVLTLSQAQGATSFFTIDGTTPNTTTSPWFNTNPIVLNNSETIKAMAVAPFFNNSAVATSSFVVDASTWAVPRSGLMLWLRSDKNVIASGGSISEWDDLSGLANNATQSVSGNRPTLVNNVLNGSPAVTFGTSQYFQIPSGMADFTGGASIFAVLNPTSVTAGARILDFGNGTASNNLLLQEPSTNGAALYAFSGASSSNVTASSALNLNQFQVLEAVHNGAASGTLYTNSVQQAQNSLNNLLNVTRANNYIGQASGGGNNYIGQLTELLVYNRGLTATERTSLEGYLLTRSQTLVTNTVPAPIFSISTSTLAAPAQVALEGPAEATFYYTLNGATPTTSSTLYSGPINISWTQTLKAIAVAKGVQSSVTTATYTLDSNQWPAPAATSTPLQLDLQLPNQSIPQDSNQH